MKMWALVLSALVVLEVSASEPLVLTTPSDPWTAPLSDRRSAPPGVTAVEGSCALLPCSFDPTPFTRLPSFWRFTLGGRWLRQEQTVASSMSSRPPASAYKGRSRLVGRLESGRCSLLLDRVKASDSGTYSFRLRGLGAKKNHDISRTTLHVRSTPPTPALSLSIVGKYVSASCSARFFCEADPPLISWSKKVDMFSQSRRVGRLGAGQWRIISTIWFPLSASTFMKVLNCTATYKGGRQASSSIIVR